MVKNRKQKLFQKTRTEDKNKLKNYFLKRKGSYFYDYSPKPWSSEALAFHSEQGGSTFEMEQALLLGFEEDAKMVTESSSSSAHRLVPWLNWDEWLFVKNALFSDSPHSVYSALKRVTFLTIQIHNIDRHSTVTANLS